jgi:ribosome-binding factor A
MASLRMHKLNELFKREIGQIIQRDLANPRIGFATVTHAEISSDLKHAAIRVSVMGDEQQRGTAIDELNKAAGFIQHVLSRRITIRTMPQIQFKLDRSLDAVYRVEELLNEVHEQQAPDEPSNEAEPEPSEEGNEPDE